MLPMKAAVHPTRQKQKAAKYAFIGYRPSAEMDGRLRRLAKVSGLSISQLTQMCVASQIAAMEAKWGAN
jgi:hypothetical protein